MSKRKDAKKSVKNAENCGTACTNQASKNCGKSYGSNAVNGINKYDADMCGHDNVSGNN